jgi:nucleoid-associated protein YgaU
LLKLLLFSSLALLLGAAALWQRLRFGGPTARSAWIAPPPAAAPDPDKDEILLALGGGPPPRARRDPPARARPLPAPAASPPAAPSSGREEQVLVRKGDTLSGIVRAHYGSARTALVEAVRERNGLESADRLREGALLVLPPLPASR